MREQSHRTRGHAHAPATQLPSSACSAVTEAVFFLAWNFLDNGDLRAALLNEERWVKSVDALRLDEMCGAGWQSRRSKFAVSSQ